MFNGSLIDDLFAAVRKAEKSARPVLPQKNSRESNSEKPPEHPDRPGRKSEAE
jgi:hypothetical protein